MTSEVLKRDGSRTPTRGVSERVERAASVVIDAAYRVHSRLGPGLLESVYERCLSYEIRKAGLSCECQIEQPVVYDGHQIDGGLRLDLLVDGCLIVELKAVASLEPIHLAQTLTYLKLSDRRLALLINFNLIHLKGNIKRVIR